MSKNIYLDREYLHNNPTWHIEDSPWKAKQIKEMLDRKKIRFTTLAEVGCGAGEILLQLKNSYNDPVKLFTGYEISPDAFAFASERQSNGLVYYNEDIEQKDVYFDVMLMIDVFEHVENYIDFIKNFKSKSAYKIFHIPLEISVIAVLRNKLIAARHSVGHLHFFMKETALAMLSSTGLEIIDHFYTPGALELPNKPFKTRLINYPRKFMYSINADLAVRIFGGYSLLVLAK